MSKARDIADLGSNDVLETSSTGVEVTGDVSLGDNGKVKLGAGDDLQIYHDGSASYIADTGTGTLNIKASGSIRLRGNDTDELLARFNENGSNQFYYDNAEKLATTSTGVDVTGTLVADGLTITTATPSIKMTDSDNNADSYIQATDGNLRFYADDGNEASDSIVTFNIDGSEKVRISASGNVGIGTASPERPLHIASATPYIVFEETDASQKFSIGSGGGKFFLYDETDSAQRLTVDTSGNVGIGTASPITAGGSYTGLNIDGSGASLALTNSYDQTSYIYTGTTTGELSFECSADMRFRAGSTERARIDSSGNFMVGTTSITHQDGSDTEGFSYVNGGFMSVSRSIATPMYINRQGNNGAIAEFRKDGLAIGAIGTTTAGNFAFYSPSEAGIETAAVGILPMMSGVRADNQADLGYSSSRWDDVYATNGTIQTSDRNEKQDIETLSEAEQRVAQACKGLLRKFRWQDSVEEKGDDARIHFGIIAQDLQDAFTAEGLDAGRYAMFISSTWTDEETGEERTRLGVRYPELLAFIISAL